MPLRAPASKVRTQKRLLAELLLQSSEAETYPASLAQQRLWFLDQLESKSSAYNVHLGFWLEGPLDMPALKASLQEIMKRHDSLRTSFRLEGSELVQLVTRDLQLDLLTTTVTGSGNLYKETYELAKAEVEAVFDLRKSPLFRARIFRVTATAHVLLCTMHHIVTDSWSMQILAKELSTLYEAFSNQGPSPLPELPISYGDYSEWQHKWFKTAIVQQQLTFWKNELKEAPAVLELQMQHPRPSEQTFAGASQTVQIGDEVISELKALAIHLQATPFMLLLAAFKILLYRASGRSDVLVGVPVAGRNRFETEGLVGFFVNTLVLRDDLYGNRPFSDLVVQVRETMFRAFANADVPFEKVVEALQPERNLSYNPIFQVMFSVIKAAVQSHTFGNLTAYPYVVTPNTSILDLSMTIIEGVDGHWWAQMDYNTELFRAEDVGGILAAYTTLLGAIIADPEKRILDFPVSDAIGNRLDETLSSSPRAEQKPAAVTQTLCRSKLQRPGEPVEPEEKLLVDIWKNLLRMPEVGIDDNFFEIGGHSLLAAQLIAQVRSSTKRKVAVSAVFRAPTIRAFAKLLKDDALAQPDPLLMKLHEGNHPISFFAVAAPGVDTFGFAQLARHLPADQSLHKLQASDSIVLGRPRTTEEMQTLCNRYISAMRSAQPQGPYCLGAMCGGVWIAQQMTLQLESEGEEVALFAIFDTWVVENSQIRSLWALDYYLQRLRTMRTSTLHQQLATVRRVFRRMMAPNKTPSNPNRERGWGHAFWPGKDFQPPQFRAPVLLFKRPRQPYFYVRDPLMGWGARSKGGVEICELHCGHVEMFREPYVRLVGKALTNRLQTIRNQGNIQLPNPGSEAELPSKLDFGSEAGCPE